MKKLFLVFLLFTACTKPEPLDVPQPKVDIVAINEQEGVLEITPDRYNQHPTSWHTRGKVLNAVWQNGELVSGDIYHISPSSGEWENIGRQAVLNFSPDPVHPASIQ